MSDFTRQLARDFAVTFANSEEFGEEISWNGKPVDGCIEDLGTRAGDDMGVNRRECLVFILASDIDEPVVGEQILLNGERWYVSDVFDLGGCFEITLFQEVS